MYIAYYMNQISECNLDIMRCIINRVKSLLPFNGEICALHVCQLTDAITGSCSQSPTTHHTAVRGTMHPGTLEAFWNLLTASCLPPRGIVY